MLIGWLERQQPDISIEDIQSIVPPTASVIVVNEAQGDHGLPEPRTTFPFLERNGEYWGPPSNGRVALSELERLRRLGASYIVFSLDAFWWLSHYPQLARYLRSQCESLRANDRVRIFALPALGRKTPNS